MYVGVEMDLYLENYDVSMCLIGPTPTPTETPFPSASPTPTASPTPVCIKHGDVTLDGAITAGDPQLAFGIVMGFHDPSDEEWCAADCNDDDNITAGDPQAIFGVIFGGSCADPL